MAVRAWLIGKRELQVGGHPLLGGGTSHASNSGRPGSLAVESTRLSPRMQLGLANASEGAARGFEPSRSLPCRVVSCLESHEERTGLVTGMKLSQAGQRVGGPNRAVRC